MVRSYMDRGKKAWKIQRCAAVNGTCRFGLGRAPTFGCTTLVVAKQQLGRFGFSIVANIGIIADSLDQNSPALKDVITPDEPAKSKVLEVSPLEQTATLWNRIVKSIRKYF